MTDIHENIQFDENRDLFQVFFVSAFAVDYSSNQQTNCSQFDISGHFFNLLGRACSVQRSSATSCENEPHFYLNLFNFFWLLQSQSNPTQMRGFNVCVSCSLVYLIRFQIDC